MYKRARVERLAGAQARSAARADHSPAVVIPDVITFVTSPEYLNRPRIYPRQALLLKLIFLQTQLLTSYDHRVIAEWGTGFTPVGEPGARHFEGGEGLPTDVVDRVEWL